MKLKPANSKESKILKIYFPRFGNLKQMLERCSMCVSDGWQECFNKYLW